METKTVVCDKSLRDIWTATDKSTIDILQDTGELSQNINSPNKASPLVFAAEKTSSYFNSLEKENLKDVQGLFQPDICKFEDDNVSLYSIWTPTNNDNLKNELKKSFNETPLIDLDISGSSNTTQTNAYAFPTNSPYETHESPLINLDVPENSNTYICASSKDHNNENHLIDLEITENSYPTHKNKCTLPEDYTYRNISSYHSGSKPDNDNVSEKSLDELNEETFGKFSSAPNELELTLSDISEATAAYKLNDDKDNQGISKTPRVLEYSETSKDMQEMRTGTKPKKYITKVYKQNNIQQYYQRKGEEKTNNYKNTREWKNQNGSNQTNIKQKTDGVLSLSRENSTNCNARPLQGNFKKNYANNERKRMATRTRETFYNVFPNEQNRVVIHNRETFHKNGNASYYTTEKTTYVRGEKLENTDKKIHKDHENNIVWRNISDIDQINDRESIRNYDAKIRDNAVPHHYNKDKKLSNFDMKTSYEECKLEGDNRYRFKNQNNSKNYELKQSNYLDQSKPSKNGIHGEKFTFREETTTQCIWQSSTDFSNSDEPDNTSQNKTYGYKNNHSQKIVDIEHNDKKNNVIHFKVYDPKLRRPTKKKITINQYREHMKFKGSFTQETGVSYTTSGGAMKKNSREEFDSKISPDIYPIHMNNENEKTVFPYKASGGSINNALRDQFEFLENINLNRAEKESKTFVKDVLSGIELTNSNDTPQNSGLLGNSTAAKKNDAKKHLKSLLIRDGKEIADLIVGCQRSLDIFKSFYYEWVDLRKQSISLLEQIVTIINQSSKKNDTMKHVIAALNIAADAANLIPHAGVALTARVAGAVGGFLANVFTRTDCKKDVNAKEFEIKEIFQKDMDSSSSAYIYGVQCSSQFQETCDVINKFYKQLIERNYQSIIDNAELLEFMNEMAEYNSANTLVFYRRIRLCYERLIKSSNSEDSRAFVRVFEDVPDAVSVIDLLPWKFDSDGFDNSIVQSAWDELFLLFQDGNPATVDIIENKIQDCLLFLKKEHRILSRNVRNLFKDTFKEL